MRPQIHSYDVFDTCVSRLFAHPRDLFFELGRRIAPSNLSTSDTIAFARDFQIRRIRAEKRALRLAQPHRCADLFEIYKEFQAPLGLTVSPQQMAEAEIALEKESIYVVPEVLKKIAQSRDSGARIIFISDMYLPGAVLAPLLQELGIMQPGDALYVSCDIRLSKHAGTLYEHVLGIERADPENVLHFGDNLHSDVKMAMQQGISASHYASASLSEYERRIAGKDISLTHAKSRAAALSRMSRLTKAEDNGEQPHPLDFLFHSTIAPFLVTYVSWVLDQARSSGVKRLYFVARDGEVLYKVAQQLLPPNDELELRYLYGSRRAWFAPSITRDSTIWQRILVMGGMFNSCFDVLSRAGLDSDAQLKVLSALNVPEDKRSEDLDHGQAATFLESVLKHPVASAVFFDSASAARDVTLKYFSQEGLLDNIPWAIVDLGWSLNCQAALRRIISTVKGDDFQPLGYYIDLAVDHLSPKYAGIARTFMPERGSLFSRRRHILEHCVTPATHATTKGYTIQGDRAVPIFGTEIRSQTEIEYAVQLQKVAAHYARLVREYPAFREGFLALGRTTVDVVENFISNPMVRDARFLSAFGTIPDMRHEGSFMQPLCGSMGLEDLWLIVGRTISTTMALRGRGFMWLEGSRALSPLYIRIPVNGMLWVDSTLKRLLNRRKRDLDVGAERELTHF